MKLIIVLGYTLRPDASLHPILKSRLDEVIAIHEPDDEIIVCGKYPPKLLVPIRCEITTEANAMKQYLVNHGISVSKIFTEEESTTTFETAYYCYRLFYKKLIEIKTIYIVSNAFHQPLVQYSFGKVFGNCISYTFQPVSKCHLMVDAQEVEQWGKVIHRMVNECYPELFRHVKDGDIEAIQSIIDGARNISFENCLKDILGLNNVIDLDFSEFYRSKRLLKQSTIKI